MEIASSVKLRTYKELANDLGLDPESLIPYTNYMAKIPLSFIDREKVNKSKLILVTSITPTKAGIGKTTTSIGLAMGMRSIDKNAIAVLREPSLGPVFGAKGGACGGGYAQILPMDKINLHFTGDFHAVTSANNLIAACLDNYLFRHKKYLNITWKRVEDMNDRALRQITAGMGDGNGMVYNTGFDITPASEIMAILCLAEDLNDLKLRIDHIILGYDENKEPFYCSELGITDSVALLLKDAMMPNLVQMTDGSPAIVHGGPFANIAHGCNTVVATKMGLSLCDYVITEAGFGSDLGCEKFMDIKCLYAGLNPDLVVLTLTVEGVMQNGYGDSRKDQIKTGLENVRHHVEVIKKEYNKPVAIVINKHSNFDTQADIDDIAAFCRNELDCNSFINNSFAKGVQGSTGMAAAIADIVDKSERTELTHPYSYTNDSVSVKIEKVCRNVYGIPSKNIVISKKAEKKINMVDSETHPEFRNMPICIAKTQFSFTDNPDFPKFLSVNELGTMTINDVIINGGAGFIVAVAGDMCRMPGLPKEPAANKIELDADGTIRNLS